VSFYRSLGRIPHQEIFLRMPNRGPCEVTHSEAKALVAVLPEPRNVREAEDDDDRMRIQLVEKLRARLEEQAAALESADESLRGVLTLSVDEVDELLDCMPPPPTLDDVRQRLKQAKLSMS
jgi:hypothetical protein